jgi:hypothetical protein
MLVKLMKLIFKGVKQGDSLATFLLLLVVEDLSGARSAERSIT